MKYLIIILLSFFGLSASAQLMQTNGTAGGYQWVAGKWDSLNIIPRGSDTPAIGGTKYGKSTVAAMFYKTTDSTLWIRSSNKWNQVTGSGGSVVWGDITGDITNQIDLINYVDSVIVANGGTDSLYYRGGAAVDSFFYSKNGVEYFWYANPATDRIIYGGIVTWTGTDLDYYVSACYFRKNGIYYLTSDTTVTLPALADADSSRTDVFIVQTLSDTQAQTTSITGTESANPITPQVDGQTDLYLTQITLNPNQTTGLTDTLIVYDNLSAGEFENRSSTGVTTNFSNTTNVYRVPYSANVSAINNNDIIGFGTETQRNALDYLGLSFFIKLKAVMPNSNGMLVSLWNNGVQVSNEVGIPFNRTNLNYQGYSVPMTTFGMTNAYFDSVRFRYAGGGAGISGMYFDFIYFQGNMNPGGPSTGGNNKWVTQGTAIIIDSLTIPNVYNISADTSLVATHHYVDSSIAVSGGGGTVTSFSSGDLSPLFTTSVATATTTPALSFALSNATAWQVFRRGTGTGAPSYGGLLAEHLNTTYSNGNMLITDGSGNLSWTTAGTPLNGTGYVKMSGTTPSYQSNTQLTADVNTFTQTLSGAVPAPTTLNGYFLKDNGTWAAVSGGSGTVTSVGLTMPSAFSVASSPVTTSGTLAVTGAGTTAQYIRGDGSLSTVPLGAINYVSNDSSWVGVVSGVGQNGTAANNPAGNGTTVVGKNITFGPSALISNTTGRLNTAIGNGALQYNTVGSDNLAIGDSALRVLNGNFNGNLAIGKWALANYTGTTQGSSLAIGYKSLWQSTSPSVANSYPNISIGNNNLFSLTTGSGMVTMGHSVACSTASSSNSVLIGAFAGRNATQNFQNSISIGVNASLASMSDFNTFIGYAANSVPTAMGVQNTGVGSGVMQGTAAATARFCTAIGYNALYNISGASDQNTAVGHNAGNSITTGTENLVLVSGGASAQTNVTTGSRNVMIGNRAVNVASPTASEQLNFTNTLVGNGSGSFVLNGAFANNYTTFSPTYKSSASFEVQGTAKGTILNPLMTTTQMNAISSPVNGLNVYSTDYKNQMSYNGVSWGPVQVNNYIAKSATYSALVTDNIIECTSGTFTVTLPTAVGFTGKEFTIVNSGAGTITIGTTSSQTFVNFTGTPTTLTMATLGSRTVVSNGANWLIKSSL